MWSSMIVLLIIIHLYKLHHLSWFRLVTDNLHILYILCYISKNKHFISHYKFGRHKGKTELSAFLLLQFLKIKQWLYNIKYFNSKNFIKTPCSPCSFSSGSLNLSSYHLSLSSLFYASTQTQQAIPGNPPAREAGTLIFISPCSPPNAILQFHPLLCSRWPDAFCSPTSHLQWIT